jgi:hypothetical protein
MPRDAGRFVTLQVAAFLLMAAPAVRAQDPLQLPQVLPPTAPGHTTPDHSLPPLAAGDYPHDAYSPSVDGMLPHVHGPEECDSKYGCNSCGRGPTVYWPAGVEITFLRPVFGDKRAFRSDNGDHLPEFEYDLEISPRLWFGYQQCDGWGWRIAWWEFDHDPDRVFAEPGANNEISTRRIEDFAIASDTPGDLLLGSSTLSVYTWDWEVTKRVVSDSTWSDASIGLRYALAEQSYLAQLLDVNSAVESQLTFNHWIRGIGPTLSLAATHFISCETNLFVRGRGSLLFGNQKWNLRFGEDLNLANPVITNRHGRNAEVLPIVEVQAGVGWQADQQFCNPWQPFATIAFEGQFWSGGGTAAKTDGDVAFVGFTMGVGCHW